MFMCCSRRCVGFFHFVRSCVGSDLLFVFCSFSDCAMTGDVEEPRYRNNVIATFILCISTRLDQE